MQSADVKAPGTRANVALLALAALPVVIYVVARYAGMMSLVRMGAIAMAALVLGVAFVTQPRYGIYFMIFYVFSGLNFYLGGGLAALAVMAIVMAGTLVELMRGEEWRVKDPVFLCAVTVFALVSLQSMLWARNIEVSANAYIMFLKAAALVFLTVQLIRTPRQLEWFGRMIFVGAVVTVFFGIANTVLGLDTDMHYIRGLMPRFTGSHKNPNYAAAAMTCAIPMGVFLIRHTRTVWGRVLAAAGLLAVISGVFATYSRQALFSFAFVAVAVLFKEVRNRKAYAVIFVLLIAGILLTPSYYWERVWTITEVMENVQNDWSIYLRVQAAREAWEIFKEKPFLGLGLRNFIARSGGALHAPIGAHNMYLELLSGVGLIGLLAFLSVHYSAARQLLMGVKARWRKEERWLKDFSFYLMISLISTLISGGFGNLEFTYVVWIPVAGALAAGNLRESYTES